MITVKPIGQVAAKWARRVAGASEDYSQGAQAAADAWAKGAGAGGQNYAAGVQAAVSAGRYGKGVTKAGAEKFRRGVKDKGAQRYGAGAAAAEGDFSQAMAPVLDAIGRIDLPARGVRGSEGNYARVSAVGKALRQYATGR